MNKKIYKQIAKKHSVTWQEVRDDMQSALNHAYTDPNRTILNVIKQKEVPKKEEFQPRKNSSNMQRGRH